MSVSGENSSSPTEAEASVRLDLIWALKELRKRSVAARERRFIFLKTTGSRAPKE